MHFTFNLFSTLFRVRGISLKINRWITRRHDYVGAMSELAERMSTLNAAVIGCLRVALRSCGEYTVTVVGILAKLRKATISFVMYVLPSFRPSAWNNSAPTPRIFMKICI